MAKCTKSSLIPDYLDKTLTEKEASAFETHLNSCKLCQTALSDLNQIHVYLKESERPEIDADLKRLYYNRLDRAFSTGKSQPGAVSRLLTNIDTLKTKLRKQFKLAAVATVTIICVLLGLQLADFSTTTEISETAHKQVYINQLTSKDRDYLITFFLDTHTFLGNILKMEPADINHSAHDMYQNIAQKLLIQTFVVHEIALRTNKSELLNFYTNFELVLYELSNLNPADLIDSLSAIKQIVAEGQLLQAAQKLQTETNNFKPVTQPL